MASLAPSSVLFGSLPCELRLKKLPALLTPAGCPLLGQGSEMGLCMRQPASAEESRGGGEGSSERAPPAPVRTPAAFLLPPGPPRGLRTDFPLP